MKLKWQCVRHHRFPSKELAEQGMRNAIQKYKVNLKRVYECKFCRGWHMTSKA
jgi:hypothetical protein